MTLHLTHIEKDIITEVANIGLSKAADALSVLSKEKVLLTVPRISLLTINEFEATLLEGSETDSLIIHSEIVGELHGKTLLLYSDRNASKFVYESLSVVRNESLDFTALKESFLLEISNIITGSILTQISNIFHIKIFGAVPIGPEKNTHKAVKELLDEFPAFQPLIFSVKTTFLDTGRQLSLPLILIFDTETLNKLLKIIRSSDVKHFNFLATP